MFFCKDCVFVLCIWHMAREERIAENNIKNNNESKRKQKDEESKKQKTDRKMDGNKEVQKPMKMRSR